jgi:redox-sensitive bicupin YhaK (pirin superfamily)
MYAAKSERDGEAKLNIGQGRRAWVQVISGEVHVEGETLRPGDGAGLENVETLDLKWLAGSEFIVFDLF